MASLFGSDEAFDAWMEEFRVKLRAVISKHGPHEPATASPTPIESYNQMVAATPTRCSSPCPKATAAPEASTDTSLDISTTKDSSPRIVPTGTTTPTKCSTLCFGHKEDIMLAATTPASTKPSSYISYTNEATTSMARESRDSNRGTGSETPTKCLTKCHYHEDEVLSATVTPAATMTLPLVTSMTHDPSLKTAPPGTTTKGNTVAISAYAHHMFEEMSTHKESSAGHARRFRRVPGVRISRPVHWAMRSKQCNKQSIVEASIWDEHDIQVVIFPSRSKARHDGVRIWEGLEVGGEANLTVAIQVAQLALKNRQNKEQKQRIVVFVGSPIKCEKNVLEAIGKSLKKNNVSLDVVDFGEPDDGKPGKLEALVAAVNNGGNSHIIHVPPGKTALFDVLISSAILTGDGGRSEFAAASSEVSGFEFGVDPNVDPDLALALRLSMEEEKARQESAVKKTGVKEACNAAFVLVAGGLGERLGYKGIKVALPRETAIRKCFPQHYIESILALQEASCKMVEGDCHTKIPFVIMTSDDTNALTINLLESNSYFGMEPSQVKILKQEEVACLSDNNARLAFDPNDKYKIQTKPHGHGDVHSSNGRVQAQNGFSFSRTLMDCSSMQYHQR